MVKCPFCGLEMKVGGVEVTGPRGSAQIYWYSSRTFWHLNDKEMLLSRQTIPAASNQVLAYKCENCRAVTFRYGNEWNKTADRHHDQGEEQFSAVLPH